MSQAGFPAVEADVTGEHIGPVVKSESETPALDQLFALNESDFPDVIKVETAMASLSDQVDEADCKVEVLTDVDGQPSLARKTKVKVVKHEPILFPSEVFPSAKDEAALAFQELESCTYQSKEFGETGQEEMMSCDCKPQIAADGENYACGEDSDCINRLTSIECTDDECNCGTRCSNQRFQLREYAAVDVFNAGRKGYGLRAIADLHKEMFVYEYVGEVIGEKRFRQRQREYEEQGEKHFYFMMLQKGEYIDATKKGGFGRFVNHSCEPNCYVDKWVVGSKLRMGIFTKRNVVKGEELTFDYNVDRYGGEATPCYCGEPTCLGYIGGKTQTEAANKLPRNVVEALGIDDGDDWDDLKPKSTRRRKKGQDDEEYVNDLTPRSIVEKDVPKIMATLLQTTERWLLKKLLQRILNDGDEKIQTKIVALHGYQTLGSKLEKWKDDPEISIIILQVLQKWPTYTKNKIASSKIETHVKALVESANSTGEIKELSTRLLDTWSNLEMAYRIPRRIRPTKTESTDDVNEALAKKDDENQSSVPQSSGPSTPVHDNAAFRGPRNPTYRKDQPWRRQEPLHKGRESMRPYPNHPATQSSRFAPPHQSSQSGTPVKIDPINYDLQAIIDAATKKQQEAAAALKAQEEANATREADRLQAEAAKRSERVRRHEEHKKEKEKRASEKRQAGKSRPISSSKALPQAKTKEVRISSRTDSSDEKRLERIFAKFIPNVIAKYQEDLGKDQFKKRAKEIVQILVAKEMKGTPSDLKELTESKKSKIKKYARNFMEKLIARQLVSTNKPNAIDLANGDHGEVKTTDEHDVSPSRSLSESVAEIEEQTTNLELERAGDRAGSVDSTNGDQSPAASEDRNTSELSNGLKRSFDEENEGTFQHDAKRVK